MSKAPVITLVFTLFVAAAFAFNGKFDILGACSDNDTLLMKSDAYQWPTIKPMVLDYLYHEWWFFTCYDVSADLGFVFSYSVSDPENIFGKGRSGFSSMVWPHAFTKPEELPHLVTDEYALDDFHASEDNATLSIDKIGIDVVAEGVYDVVGSSRDGLVNFQLRYEQEVYPCRQEEKLVDVGLLAWESYMPSAKVTGEFEYNGAKVAVNGRGYKDKNWGAWPTSIFNWVWSQFNDESQDFAFVLGGYKVPLTKDTYIGYLFFRHKGVRQKIGTLCGDSFQLKVLEVKQDGKYKYASHTNIVTHNDEWKLEIDFKEHTAAQNPGGKGLSLVVFEMISKYDVVLYKADGGSWQKVMEASGYGWNEWSDLT